MKNWLRSQNSLFFGVVVGTIVEISEMVHGSCSVWQQELLILALIGVMSFSVRNPKISYLATLGLVGIYAMEFYEQFVEFETCSFAASELTPLLLAALLSAFSIVDVKRWKKG